MHQVNVTDICKALVECDVKVEARACDGRTAFHETCESGHVTVVSLLLEHEADVNEVGGYGPTDLHWACRVGRAVSK